MGGDAVAPSAPDRHPRRPPRRIAVHGASGSGKTTLATGLAERLGIGHTELDGLYHQPGWTELPTDEFRDAVARVVDGPAWVVDGNGPALVAEHVATGIAALAADSTDFYVATYSTVFAYSRATGNQDGQWTMPSVPTAKGSTWAFWLPLTT